MGNTRFTQIPNVARAPAGQPVNTWPGYYPPTAYFTVSADQQFVIITETPPPGYDGGGYIYTPSPASLEFDPTIPQSFLVEIHQFAGQGPGGTNEITIEVPDDYQR